MTLALLAKEALLNLDLQTLSNIYIELVESKKISPFSIKNGLIIYGSFDLGDYYNDRVKPYLWWGANLILNTINKYNK